MLTIYADSESTNLCSFSLTLDENQQIPIWQLLIRHDRGSSLQSTALGEQANQNITESVETALAYLTVIKNNTSLEYVINEEKCLK